MLKRKRVGVVAAGALTLGLTVPPASAYFGCAPSNNICTTGTAPGWPPGQNWCMSGTIGGAQVPGTTTLTTHGDCVPLSN
jgi:hypothetical protein